MAKGTPHRTWFSGEEYISILGAAQMLGVSVSTLRRREQTGLLARPAAIPRGAIGTRWYKVSEIEDNGLGAINGAGESPRRSWSLFGRPGRRSARFRFDDDDDEDWEEGVRGDAEPELALCPRCGGELLVDTMRIGGTGLEQVPRCERCGTPEEEPVAEPGTCRRCAGTVTWEVREPREGFVAVCDLHGVVEVVPDQEASRQRPAHWASFSAPPAEAGRRPRGLRLGDLQAVIRKPKAPAEPRFDAPSMPYEG